MTANKDYWAKNIRLILLCLFIWFVVSFGAGILFVEPLNAFYFGGYPLGFWFAQQGSIFSFVLLILFYNWRVRRLDEAFRQST